MDRKVTGARFDDGRGRGGALAIVACGLLGVACADEPRDQDDMRGAQSVLAQVEAPTTESVTVETKLVPITFETSFGSGCDGDLEADPSAAHDGRLQIRFHSYRVDLSQTKSTYGTKQCVVDLRVRGARGYRYAIQNVSFIGQVDLVSPRALFHFDTLVWWEGRTVTSKDPATLTFSGPHFAQWTHVQKFQAEADRASKCFASDEQVDVMRISSSLVLVNPDTSMTAAAYLNTLTSDASVVVDIEPQRCVP